jgi:hypothetical protein
MGCNKESYPDENPEEDNDYKIQSPIFIDISYLWNGNLIIGRLKSPLPLGRLSIA